jgi:hypothetical protein
VSAGFEDPGFEVGVVAVRPLLVGGVIWILGCWRNGCEG